jgi:hypothetical protein
MGHDDRHRRRDQRGRIARYDEIDFVDVKKLRVESGDLRRVALIVVIDKLDFPPEQSALGVDVLDP